MKFMCLSIVVHWNQDIEMDNRIDPFAYFRNLNVRVEETEQRDIQPMEVDQSSNEG